MNTMLTWTDSFFCMCLTYLTAFLKSGHGLKAGILCSGITTVVFLVMLRPVFAFLVFTSNVPNPRRYMF